MKTEDKQTGVGVAHVCSCCTSLVCMAQMGTIAATGGAVMGTMGAAATSGSVPLITSVFQSIGLGALLTIPASFYQILLVIVLGLTIIASYLSYKFHQKSGLLSLVIISSLLIYGSIYILMSEPLYWIAFVLMLLSMLWNYSIGNGKENGKILRSDKQGHEKTKGQAGAYFAFIVTLIIITVFGYLSFLAFAQNMTTLGVLPIVIVAVFAGLATFFSPCSFGLLPAYLSLYTKDKQKQKGTILKNGVAASLGLIAFNAILGITIAFIGLGIGSAFSISAGGQLAGVTLAIRAIVGGILFILGVLQFFHVSIQGRLFKEISQRLTFDKKGYSNYFFYGFGYNLGNIGCTGPIMAGLIILALASGFSAALFAFVVYSITMAALMLVVSLLVGSAKINFPQESSHKIMKISAIILMLAGLFIIGTVIYAKQFASLFFP